MSTTRSNIIIALDYAAADTALAFVDRIDPELCRVKVGKELFTVAGPKLIKQLVDRKFEVFLDLKYHDIPNTVINACLAAADLGVWMVNVHALGGPVMLEAVSDAYAKLTHAPKLIAVTILTSMDQQQLQAIGFTSTIDQVVQRLAGLSIDAGLDGIVCSAQDIPGLKAAKKAVPEGFEFVTPGIRPASSDDTQTNLPHGHKDDQKRVLTPRQAIQAGANYLVIGRPVTQAVNPLNQLNSIINSFDKS